MNCETKSSYGSSNKRVAVGQALQQYLFLLLDLASQLFIPLASN